jgi:uncharacterized protein
VNVKVLEVDEVRRRIALTMRLNESAPARRAEPAQDRNRNSSRAPARQKPSERDQGNGAMAEALARALGKTR